LPAKQQSASEATGTQMPTLVRSSMARLSALPLAFVLNACLYAEKKPQENLLPKD